MFGDVGTLSNWVGGSQGDVQTQMSMPKQSPSFSAVGVSVVLSVAARSLREGVGLMGMNGQKLARLKGFLVRSVLTDALACKC